MISELMLYGTKMALLIGLAALAPESVAAWRGLPRRGLWAAALVLSVALPALAVLIVRRIGGLLCSVVPAVANGGPALAARADP